MPAERTFYSRFINSNPQILGNKALPLTMREFARVLGEAADTHQLWQEGTAPRPTESHQIQQFVQQALAGKATYSRQGRYARKWQWIPEGSTQTIEIEMASFGQMATWPLVFTAQAMFAWSSTRRPLFLHIEEPETHLHPAAQIAIMKMLAFLVNQGFHLVITTHSLVVLYTLNNLTLAYKQLGDKEAKRVPEEHVRLAPDKVAAYLFANGKIENIVDDAGQIDEGLLGDVAL